MGEQQTRCWYQAGQVLPKAPHCAPGTVTHSKQAVTGFATRFVMVSGLITTTLVSSHQGNGAAQMLSCPHTSALVLVQLCSRPCFAGSLRDPAPGVPGPCQRDVSIGSHWSKVSSSLWAAGTATRRSNGSPMTCPIPVPAAEKNS